MKKFVFSIEDEPYISRKNNHTNEEKKWYLVAENKALISEEDLKKFRILGEDLVSTYDRQYVKYLEDIIKQVPKWKWKEKDLPKDYELYWVTIRDDSGDSVYWYTDVGWYFGDGCWIVNNSREMNVVAWMEKPVPFKDYDEVSKMPRA